MLVGTAVTRPSTRRYLWKRGIFSVQLATKPLVISARQLQIFWETTERELQKERKRREPLILFTAKLRHRYSKRKCSLCSRHVSSKSRHRRDSLFFKCGEELRVVFFLCYASTLYCIFVVVSLHVTKRKCQTLNTKNVEKQPSVGRKRPLHQSKKDLSGPNCPVMEISRLQICFSLPTCINPTERWFITIAAKCIGTVWGYTLLLSVIKSVLDGRHVDRVQDISSQHKKTSQKKTGSRTEIKTTSKQRTFLFAVVTK